MAVVVPTVLAATPEDYTRRLQLAARLSRRVHVDICDGRFAAGATVGLAQVHLPAGMQLDLHLMLEEPVLQLETALSLHPSLIIFHAESHGDLAPAMKQVQDLGIKAGVALLPATTPEQVQELVEQADHVLIFTGTLGQNAGVFQPGQLAKASQIRAIKPDVELSVDGGVNDQNAASIVSKGVDVLYMGAFLHDAADPLATFATLADRVGAVV
jgi:ribulose-phosphate 3-epimerase